MDFIYVIILSVIEGLTEFLPISSTAHQILASHILQVPSSDFLSTFEIAIQVGAIGAVVVVYFKKILSNKTLFYKACVGFIPTGIIGFLLFKHIKALLNSSLIPVVTLFLGGILIVLIEMYFMKVKKSTLKLHNTSKLSYKDALIIGFIQSISMIPGVSRSAASIFGGMALKLDRESAVEFSFLLAIPTMVAATGLDIIKSAGSFTQGNILALVLGILVAFLSALVVIKWLLRYVQHNNFIWFGVYRIIISIVFFFLFFHSF